MCIRDSSKTGNKFFNNSIILISLKAPDSSNSCFKVFPWINSCTKYCRLSWVKYAKSSGICGFLPRLSKRLASKANNSAASSKIWVPCAWGKNCLITQKGSEGLYLSIAWKVLPNPPCPIIFIGL